MNKETKQDQLIDLKCKLLNGDQILEAFGGLGFTSYDYRLRCFTEGVRFAEAYYNIGNSHD